MNDKSGVWGASSGGESPGRLEMLLLRLVVMAHLTENPLLLMKALLPPKPNSQTNRNYLIYLPPPSKNTNTYGTTATTPA